MAASTPYLTDEIKRQAIGLESPPLSMDVEKGAIQKFAEAIEDPNPLWNDEIDARRSRYGGIIAPPTFLRAMRTERPALPLDQQFHRLLDGGSEWEYFEPIRVGDRITAVTRISELSERSGRLGPMIFITSLTTYTNQLGQVAATQKNTLIRY